MLVSKHARHAAVAIRDRLAVLSYGSSCGRRTANKTAVIVRNSVVGKQTKMVIHEAARTSRCYSVTRRRLGTGQWNESSCLEKEMLAITYTRKQDHSWSCYPPVGSDLPRSEDQPPPTDGRLKDVRLSGGKLDAYVDAEPAVVLSYSLRILLIGQNLVRSG